MLNNPIVAHTRGMGNYGQNAEHYGAYPLSCSRYDLRLVRLGLKRVEKISPALHHALACIQMRSAIVCAPVHVTHCVGELMFDNIDAVVQNLIQYGPRHRPKSVSGHGSLGVSQGPQGNQDGVFRHRATRRSVAWKYEFELASQR